MGDTGIHAPIRTTRVVAYPSGTVFALLADLRTHWLLSDSFEVLEIHADADGAQAGARVRVHGPLGMRRTVRTSLDAVLPPSRIIGVGCAGRSAARVEWCIEDEGAARSRVELSVRLTRAGLLEHVLYAFGARRWLRGRFERVLVELERLLAQRAVEEAWTLPLGAASGVPA